MIRLRSNDNKSVNVRTVRQKLVTAKLLDKCVQGRPFVRRDWCAVVCDIWRGGDIILSFEIAIRVIRPDMLSLVQPPPGHPKEVALTRRSCPATGHGSSSSPWAEVVPAFQDQCTCSKIASAARTRPSRPSSKSRSRRSCSRKSTAAPRMRMRSSWGMCLVESRTAE